MVVAIYPDYSIVRYQYSCNDVRLFLDLVSGISRDGYEQMEVY